MLPESISLNYSQGEINLFQLLSNQLPDDFHVWHKQIIYGKNIDFLILSPNFGILIIQVISYYPNQIANINIDNKSISFYKENQDKNNVQQSPTHIYLDIPNRKTRKRSQPVQKVSEIYQYSWYQEQEFLNHIILQLQNYPALKQDDIDNINKLALPVEYSIVFSNITESQALEKNINQIFPQFQAIYRDELLSFHNNMNLLSRLKKIFTHQFYYPYLTCDQISTIKAVIFPEIAIKLVPASSHSVAEGVKLQNGSYVYKTLDYRQERIVRSIGQGHRIIYGVAGSGKTLILLSHAKLLLKINPNQKILILCFNRSLSGYLNSLLDQDINNHYFTRIIRVLTFYSWFSSEIKTVPSKGGFSTDYYEHILGEILFEKISTFSDSDKYDAILIDEAQTFHPTWFKCCVAALKDQNNGNLMIVADGGQSIYKRQNFTWKSVGVKAVGRTINKKFQLDKNYRNTQEILSAAWSIFQDSNNINFENINDNIFTDKTLIFDIVKPQDAIRHGLSPILHIEESDNQQLASIIKVIKELKADGLCLNEIAVIYKTADDNKKILITELIQKLTSIGIETYWISNNRESEKQYSINQSGIKIVSGMSALGLEFKVVLILWAQDWEFNIPALSENDVLIARKLYVAMTRAQDILNIFGSGNSKLVQELQNSGNFIVRY